MNALSLQNSSLGVQFFTTNADTAGNSGENNHDSQDGGENETAR